MAICVSWMMFVLKVLKVEVTATKYHKILLESYVRWCFVWKSFPFVTQFLRFLPQDPSASAKTMSSVAASAQLARSLGRSERPTLTKLPGSKPGATGEASSCPFSGEKHIIGACI